MTSGGNLQNISMLDLFRVEVEEKAAVVMDGLLALESDPTSAGTLEELTGRTDARGALDQGRRADGGRDVSGEHRARDGRQFRGGPERQAGAERGRYGYPAEGD
ncbi:MAG: hypothetical protein FD165_2229 [Gammaproteobacteria bacterium]|nr:MAG: hypothetical protein FD165_2229 [Gammaproteobacteria bacterium]